MIFGRLLLQWPLFQRAAHVTGRVTPMPDNVSRPAGGATCEA